MAEQQHLREVPLHVFRFEITFNEAAGSGAAVPFCQGAFAECSGLEATMEPKVINVGGQNYGPVQRVGPVTFATVILRRGITPSLHLWQWFEFVTRRHKYAYRLDATIALRNIDGSTALRWKLKHALPTKFKLPDLNATATEVGVEELHLVHEGLELLEGSANNGGANNGGDSRGGGSNGG